MILEKTLNNLRIRNKTKIKPHQSLCFIFNENPYNIYYYIVWTDGDNCLIVDYERLYLFSINQWMNNNGIGYFIKTKKYINKNEIPDTFPTKVSKGKYDFPENIEEIIKTEMEKPYFL
jgi:hypothetical protein